MPDKNKVKFGLTNVHYALITENIDPDTGALTVVYATPVRYRGGVELTMEPQGDHVGFWADDGEYWGEQSTQGYSGTLTMAMATDKIMQDVFGQTVDTTSGMIVENINDIQRDVALLMEFKGDQNATRHVMYKVSMGKPSFGSKTINENGKEVTPVEFPITVGPASDTGDVKSKASKGDPSYEKWFSAVTRKGAVQV